MHFYSFDIALKKSFPTPSRRQFDLELFTAKSNFYCLNLQSNFGGENDILPLEVKESRTGN